jgi:hypothetical protein
MDLVAKRFAASLALIPIVTFVSVAPASAITAELAKKCQALAYKSHPPTLAGVKNGTAQAQRDYYKTCIDNNGNMPADNSDTAPASNNQGTPSGAGK